jgi:hypothetical protein
VADATVERRPVPAQQQRTMASEETFSLPDPLMFDAGNPNPLQHGSGPRGKVISLQFFFLSSARPTCTCNLAFGELGPNLGVLPLMGRAADVSLVWIELWFP